METASAKVGVSASGIKKRSLDAQFQAFFHLQKVKLNELIVFTRQFHTLFKAGLSMDVILGTLCKQSNNEFFQESLEKVRDDVQKGESISDAFAKHPKIFNTLYISMLRAGEEAGILEEVLSELIHVLDKEDETRREISSATMYPKIVIGVMVIASYIMLTVIIPKFATFYDKYNAELPIPTQIMLTASNFATSYWYIVFLGAAALVFGFKKYYKTTNGKFNIDSIKLKAPVFGTLFRKIEMARFGHIFSALYRSGLPMIRTLEILSGIMTNQVYTLEVRRIRAGLIQGKSLADMMRSSNKFPPIVVETTSIGEKAGNLDDMLSANAHHFDLEVKHLNKNLTTMLEPILLGLIFGMVTLMVLAIFLPMWNLSSVVLKK